MESSGNWDEVISLFKRMFTNRYYYCTYDNKYIYLIKKKQEYLFLDILSKCVHDYNGRDTFRLDFDPFIGGERISYHFLDDFYKRIGRHMHREEI